MDEPQLSPLASSLEELFELMSEQQREMSFLTKLLLTDTMKFISRPIRDDLIRRVLDRMGDIEDSTRAIIKTARSVKRQRLSDDKQVSNLFMNIADLTALDALEYGQVTDFSTSTYPNISKLLNHTPDQLRLLDEQRRFKTNTELANQSALVDPFSSLPDA